MELFEHLGQSVHGQVSGMDRGIGQAAQSLKELLTLECGGLCQRLTLDHLSKARACGNGCNTAACAVTNLIDPAIGELNGKAHNVAADGMLQTDLGVWRVQLTYVARVLKVVEDCF